jgi:5'-deoxynucleotidase YfbR-like HD superfamily hydrolase
MCASLQTRVKEIISTLTNRIDEANKYLESLMHNDIESIPLQSLENFQKLSIITTEEEYLTICKDADESHQLAEAIIKGSSKISLSELENLTEKIDSILTNLNEVFFYLNVLKNNLSLMHCYYV